MKKLLLRFNTMHNGTDLKWRVIIDGKEYLASNVSGNVRLLTTEDMVEGVGIKHHVTLIYNNFQWSGSNLILS